MRCRYSARVLGMGTKLNNPHVLRHTGHVNAATRVIPTVRLDPTTQYWRGEPSQPVDNLTVRSLHTRGTHFVLFPIVPVKRIHQVDTQRKQGACEKRLKWSTGLGFSQH